MKKKLLISAYGCEPNRGSESGVGWNWVLQLAKHYELHVVTRSNNKELIELCLPNELKNKIIFYYYDPPCFFKKLKNKAKGLYLFYFIWQVGIIPLISKLKRKYEFDYSIHLTFGSLWMPTFLPLFKIPFIWGPVGGGDSEPFLFWRCFPLRSQLSMAIRYLLKITSLVNPFVFLSSWRAVAILARTVGSANVIPFLFRKKVRVVLETAMEGECFLHEKKHEENKKGSVSLIFTGRLEANKNIDTLIYALSYIPYQYDVCLTILGEGSQEKKLITLAEELGVRERVIFAGNVPRDQIFAYLEESDIFLFPSLREGGSWALMEAMSVGIPVICCNIAGMKIITDDGSAIRLEVRSPEQLRHDFASSIISLIEDTERREQIGKNARQRIREHFNWESKGEFMENLFRELDQTSSSSISS